MRRIVVGILMAVGSALWWHAEVAGRIGEKAAAGAFGCLIRLGSGSCEGLWFVGLHQENIIAGTVFYVGALIAVLGAALGRLPSPSIGSTYKHRSISESRLTQFNAKSRGLKPASLNAHQGGVAR